MPYIVSYITIRSVNDDKDRTEQYYIDKEMAGKCTECSKVKWICCINRDGKCVSCSK